MRWGVVFSNIFFMEVPSEIVTHFIQQCGNSLDQIFYQFSVQMMNSTENLDTFILFVPFLILFKEKFFGDFDFKRSLVLAFLLIPACYFFIKPIVINSIYFSYLFILFFDFLADTYVVSLVYLISKKKNDEQKIEI